MADNGKPASDQKAETPRYTEEQLKAKSVKELDALLGTAKHAMSDCMLQSSWTFTVPSVLLSVPLSIHFKTYSPLVFSAITASGIDFYHASRLCSDLKENIDKIKYAIALKKVGDMKDVRPPWL